MGTAPDTRQPLAMPDPERTVARSIRLLRRRPMSERAAAATVAIVAAKCIAHLAQIGIVDVTWLADVHLAAAHRAAELNPENTEFQGDTDANRSSSTAGGPAPGEDRTPPR